MNGREIVKYDNDFNNQALRKFTSEELNLLMTIFHKVREKDTELLKYSFYELKRLIKLDNNIIQKDFIKILTNVNKKLLALNYTFETEELIVQFALFREFVVNKKEKTLTVAVSERFKFLLNDFDPGKWTRFELEEFIDLKSSYTKEFYRRMKQFRSTGKWIISMEDFRNLLDVPKSYSTSDIDKNIFKPVLNELGEKYNVNIEKKYGFNGGRGRSRVTGFEITFKIEKIDSKKIEKPKNDNNPESLIGRTLRVKDSVFDRYNSLKILSIKNSQAGVIVRLRNADDGYENDIVFKNLEVLQNWVKKYLI